VARAPEHAWYRQGIVWLGLGVFVASIAGSVWLIRVAHRYADPPLSPAEVSGPTILKMPLARPERVSRPPPEPPPEPRSEPR